MAISEAKPDGPQGPSGGGECQPVCAKKETAKFDHFWRKLSLPDIV
jgi:hypothetical protein